MKIFRAGIAAACAAIAMGPLAAAAQNLLTNGSFEAGLTGWTSSGGTCSPGSYTAGQTTVGAGAWTTPAPTDGTNVYAGDTGSPGTCTFFQAVTLPPDVSQATLSYAAGYNFQDFGAGPAGCSASIAVTTTTNVPIATGYAQVAAPADDPLAVQSPIVFNTTPGGTVRVLFTETSCTGGPVGLVADNLVLVAGAPNRAVPTLDDWAKGALALLLAASAMVCLKRRSRN
jgi:hypothetical protein